MTFCSCPSNDERLGQGGRRALRVRCPIAGHVNGRQWTRSQNDRNGTGDRARRGSFGCRVIESRFSERFTSSAFITPLLTLSPVQKRTFDQSAQCFVCLPPYQGPRWALLRLLRRAQLQSASPTALPTSRPRDGTASTHILRCPSVPASTQ